MASPDSYLFRRRLQLIENPEPYKPTMPFLLRLGFHRDVGGQDGLCDYSITKWEGYLPQAHAVPLVFSIASKRSLEELEDYTRSERWSAFQGVRFLVGAKCDLAVKKEVPLETGEKKAGILGCKYFKVSAKTGQNIPEIFHELPGCWSSALI
jgi:GTPase SAR1 family protein